MLTASKAANSKPRLKPYKLADGRGLFLLVHPTGSKYWRMKYRRPDTCKENTLALGVYPDVFLRQARERREKVRKFLAESIS